MTRITIQVLIVLGFLCTTCQTSLAHKIRIFAWQDGDKIVTESKFSRGKPAQNATVTVIDADTGKSLLSGTTDTEGLFSFPIAKISSKELQIIVDGGDGHKNSWNYTLEDSAPGYHSDSSTPEPTPQTSDDSVVLTDPSPKTDEVKIPQTISPQELTRIIDTALDRKLAPIRRTLAENSEQGPSVQDILGGLGYILGLAGIAAYMQSLKNKEE